MPASQLTITAPTGPASTATALVLTNVTKTELNTWPKNTLEVTSNGKISIWDINATTTYTITISAGVCTMVVSQ